MFEMQNHLKNDYVIFQYKTSVAFHLPDYLISPFVVCRFLESLLADVIVVAFYTQQVDNGNCQKLDQALSHLRPWHRLFPFA